MAYVPIPKDLSNVKTKIVFNLTQRQLVCFSIAAVVGIPIFFLCQDGMGSSSATLIMMFAMSPFFMLAMYEKHNQPLEVILKNYVTVKFLTPKQRPYMTDNFYATLERQNQLDMEVKYIVEKSKHNSHTSRKKKNSKCNRQRKK